MHDLRGYVYEYFLNHDYELDVEADTLIGEYLKKVIMKPGNKQIPDSINLAKTAVNNAEKRTARLLANLAETGDYSNADIMTIHREDIPEVIGS